MTNEIAVREPMQIAYNEEQVDLIKRTIAKDATTDELALFVHQCKRTGLDPFSRQIHFVKRSGQMTIQVGIDGFRLIADRTGKYVGSDEPLYGDSQKEKWGERPITATVTVHKWVPGTGGKSAFTSTVRWSEFYPGEGNVGFMWRKMPFFMLAKVAESHALRKAFPQELSGLYTPEEMDQANTDTDAGPTAVKEAAEVTPDLVTTAQIRALNTIGSKLEWDEDTRRKKAGVLSFKSLTKKRAGELIEEWKTLLDKQREEGDTKNIGDGEASKSPSNSDEPVRAVKEAFDGEVVAEIVEDQPAVEQSAPVNVARLELNEAFPNRPKVRDAWLKSVAGVVFDSLHELDEKAITELLEKIRERQSNQAEAA